MSLMITQFICKTLLGISCRPKFWALKWCICSCKANPHTVAIQDIQKSWSFRLTAADHPRMKCENKIIWDVTWKIRNERFLAFFLRPSCQNNEENNSLRLCVVWISWLSTLRGIMILLSTIFQFIFQRGFLIAEPHMMSDNCENFTPSTFMLELFQEMYFG